MKHDLQPFDPHALIAKTRQGPLRIGETHALSVHVRGLERSLEHNATVRVAEARAEAVSVCLNQDMSALLVVFPGYKEHTVALPLDRPDLAMDFLTRALRERRGATNFVGTAGAPTQADLAALAKASGKAARKVGTLEQVSLEDLGL